MDFWTDIMPATLSAAEMLESASHDMSRLRESVRIFLLVNGAQGVTMKPISGSTDERLHLLAVGCPIAAIVGGVAGVLIVLRAEKGESR